MGLKSLECPLCGESLDFFTDECPVCPGCDHVLADWMFDKVRNEVDSDIELERFYET